MVLTHSEMIPIGTPLPNITLPDLAGAPVSLLEARGDGVLAVVFACNHCPYVRHIESGLGKLADEFADTDATFAAICSNDVSEYPDDDVPGLRQQANRSGWHFPYLIDRDQEAALAFGAACTPDIFVFGRDGALAYRGALDGASPGNDVAVTGDLLREALVLTIANQPVPKPHRPAMGCGIKWLPGNEPA